MKTGVKILAFTGIAVVTLGGYFLGKHVYAPHAAYDAAQAHIAQQVEEEKTHIDLSAFHDLKRIPENLAEIPGLVDLILNGTKVSDLEPLRKHTTLVYLAITDTWVEDLSPLAGLDDLEFLDIDGTWIANLSPLAKLPSLKRLEMGRTQIASLAPLRDIQSLEWLNLHAAYSIDGSRDHYEALFATVPEVFNGTAFQANYRPDPRYLKKVRVTRLFNRYFRN